MVFLAAENENRQLRDLPQADFGRVHENISFDDKEKVNNWEFCEKKATPIIYYHYLIYFSIHALEDSIS